MIRCTTREIIQEVPEVQTVVLPDDWFEGLDGRRPVFVSLYEWMLQGGRVPPDTNRRLDGRTYVGDRLFKKLCAAEKKRLAKRLKIKGEDLERALEYSDMGSGPQTRICGYEISGDVILVVPDSSREAFNEFSTRFARKTRESVVDKTRSSAAGATFYQWLAPQVGRPDRVGDLARDAELDAGFPRCSNEYEEIKSYLRPGWDRWQHSPVIESLKEGWLEYLRQYPGRVPAAAWCSECAKKIEVRDALLAWDTEDSYELHVLDAQCLIKYNGFGTMMSRPLAGITAADLERLVEEEELSELDMQRWQATLRLWGILPVGNVDGWVYFIRSEHTHAIKIGFTAGKVEVRLKALQTAHPYKLEVVGKSRGTMEYEKALHSRFEELRLEGEWFEPHPDLLAFISILPSG